MSGLSDDFQKSCVQRQPQVSLISNLLDSDSDMIIYGISGSGKTTLIRDLLQEKQINYVKINCIQCQTKKTVIQALISSLEAKFNYKLKQTTKTSQLIHRINQLHEFTKQQELDENSQQYFSFEDHHFYLWLDNIEKLSITPKFFSQLISIKNILKINFCIIFSGITFQDQAILENSEIDLLPAITLQPIDIKNLKNVIKINLQNKLLDQEKKCFEVFGDKFINDMVQNFNIIIKNATTMCSICLKLFKFLINSYDRKENPQIKDFVHLIKEDNFVYARKLILQDPYLNEGDTKEFIEKITNNKSIRSESFSLISPIQIAKLPFYSSMILLACWIGNRNPESTDKKLFKDYKGRQYKGKQEGTLQFLKPIKIDRMIALAQCLISQSEFIKNYSLNRQSELNLYDQSVDFYSQIASLIEMKYITLDSSEASLAKAQYISTLDEQFILSIAHQNKIKLYDFLYKKE
ncbi:AAA family ATPase (macronuclear) [Tetrahymena thermophila SB210]|uniref:AAA family ATPase n=1 Tax=Tetrahymena thermophila (strain SB210) TaxID=312017 RepID=I7MCE7_TETTS|nr:AAA family ATPase [Tetrahymena thermophila SB210]EAR83758.1 AAA family ATPase [Tetrahymena thermophila SB210]|eukprot:XP_001031421.1 AAA family ATPase [Tetrahymena thermophila SB210]